MKSLVAPSDESPETPEAPVIQKLREYLHANIGPNATAPKAAARSTFLCIRDVQFEIARPSTRSESERIAGKSATVSRVSNAYAKSPADASCRRHDRRSKTTMPHAASANPRGSVRSRK